MSDSTEVLPVRRHFYSREKMISFKAAAALVENPVHPVAFCVPRQNRKKSKSCETEGQATVDNSAEDVVPDVVDAAGHPWSRNARQHHNPQSSGHAAGHQRQRYPSGPHGDSNQTVSNAHLRPAPTESRRGGYGDWSKGCAGWRQRSYSGSERSGFGLGQNQPYACGRGVVDPSAIGTDFDNPFTHFRGRGRATGRHGYSHRGSSARGLYSSSGARRPDGSVGANNQSGNLEEFWQDEALESMELDSGNASSMHSQKSRECSHTKVPTQDPVTTSTTGGTTSALTDDASVSPSKAKLDHASSVNKEMAKSRVYSKSCSVEPPPGFDLPLVGNSAHSSSVSAGCPPHSAEVTTAVSTALSTKWYYIDSVGKTQGPFGNPQMASWLAGGYLPLGIKVRRDCDECFLLLMDHMNLAGRIPFWNGYNQPPITQRLASIMANASQPPWCGIYSSTPIQPTLHHPETTVSSDLTTGNSSKPQPPLLPMTPDSSYQSFLQSTANPVVVPVGAPEVLTDPGGLTLETVPTKLIDENQAIFRLCSEAQALAAHAARVEAERQELANKLAAINSTAVKLMALSPGLTSLPLIMPERFAVPPQTAQPIISIPPDSFTNTEVLDRPVNAAGDAVPEASEPEVDKKMADLSVNDDGLHIGEQKLGNEQPKVGSDDSRPILDKSASLIQNATVDNNLEKKSKKKNKKPKKGKPSAEQERQMAWDAEFARRKAAALERKLVEEAEAKRIADEEAAIKAEEQAAIEKERKRLLVEQRKQEMARAKANSELTYLRLPQSTRWANTSTSAVGEVPSSLLSIQADQTSEETRQKNYEMFLSQQAAAVAAAEASCKVVPPRPNAWTSVVVAEAQGASKQPSAAVHTQSVKPGPPAKAEFPNRKPTLQSSAPQPPRTPPGRPANKKSPASNISSHPPPVTTVTSVWDLPNTDGILTKDKNKKKKKKSRASNESASFAAKEQLAHWCESQLSTMAISGVDLPTLVDLLCELEAADQVVECIETSLGRSKLISNFSKAFLEKRAFILNGIH